MAKQFQNPANVVNSILNRQGRPFRRMGDCWFHEKFFQQEPKAPMPSAVPAKGHLILFPRRLPELSITISFVSCGVSVYASQD